MPARRSGPKKYIEVSGAIPTLSRSRRGKRTLRTCITVAVPGSIVKSKAPATELLSSSALMCSTRSPGCGSCTQKAVKIGNSSGPAPAVPIAKPRAERP